MSVVSMSELYLIILRTQYTDECEMWISKCLEAKLKPMCQEHNLIIYWRQRSFIGECYCTNLKKKNVFAKGKQRIWR